MKLDAGRGPPGHASRCASPSRPPSAAPRRSSSCSSPPPRTASPATPSAWPTSTPSTCPRRTTTALHVLRDFLAPHGLRPRDRATRASVLPAFARVRGHEMAKAALEMAVWELWARREGAPLWRVLGGRGGSIEAGRLGRPAARRGGAPREGRGARSRPATGASRSRSSRAATWRSSRRCAAASPSCR